MKPEDIKIEVKDDKVYMTQKNQELIDKDKNPVGTRDTVDIYPIEHAMVLKQAIMDDRNKILDQLKVNQEQLNENGSKFSNEKINKIKKFIAQSQEAAAYNKMANLRAQRENLEKALEKVDDDMKMFKDIPEN